MTKATNAFTSCGVARGLLVLFAATASTLLLASCGAPRDRGVPVRVEVVGGGVGARHGVPVRVVVIDPVSIGAGGSAEVTIKLEDDAHLLGQHVAVFYDGDLHLLTDIPSSSSTPENHTVEAGSDSVTYSIKAAETSESGTVKICAKSYDSTHFECAEVTITGSE